MKTFFFFRLLNHLVIQLLDGDQCLLITLVWGSLLCRQSLSSSKFSSLLQLNPKLTLSNRYCFTLSFYIFFVLSETRLMTLFYV